MPAINLGASCKRDEVKADRIDPLDWPLLQMARKVTVVEVVDAYELSEADLRVKDVVDWLEGHDTVEARVEHGDENAAVLSRFAQELKAGLLVAGAYGHSRLREWVLGGVTRDLLLPTQCSFVSH